MNLKLLNVSFEQKYIKKQKTKYIFSFSKTITNFQTMGEFSFLSKQ